ncbi:MAG: hypothetical protein WCY78_03035 [Sphaerochaetaceae bacterium]
MKAGKTTSFKKVLGLTLALLLSISLLAAADMSYDVKLLGSSAPEIKVEAGAVVKIPMLQGEGLLTRDNNLKIKGRVGVSPVSNTWSVEAVLTPLAVAEVSLGGTLGMGWDLTDSLKGLKYIGRCSEPSEPYEEASESVKGIYLKGKAGAALQFDTAALFSSKWASVFARVYQEVSIQNYTNLEYGNAWNFELSGYRGNGWFYHAEYVVGYNMPIFLDKVALMVETDINNFSDFMKTDILVTLSPILNFKVLDGLNITALVQFNNKADFVLSEDKMADNRIQRGPLGFSKAVGMVTYSF